MKTEIIVREYARLTTDNVSQSLDQATISQSAFDWLCNLSTGYSKQGASLLHIENRRWLCLDSYVGVVETPCGTVIEILPKHLEHSDAEIVDESRQLLFKMLQTSLDLSTRSAGIASLSVFKSSLLEWVMSQFINHLEALVKRGLRFEYQNIDDNQKFLRGRLDVNKQLRQPPSRLHILNIKHDVFLVDRPENRLLKSALIRVSKKTKNPDTWRMARDLMGLLFDLPESEDFSYDLDRWSNNRLMAHYKNIQPWCRLVLSQFMPLATRGSTKGISLLFPMEKLFEKYVEIKLRNQILPPYQLKAQAKSQSLCVYQSNSIFQLRPDLLLQLNNSVLVILDTKWKLIDQTKRSDNYNLTQSDFYQMFAYGNKYFRDKKGDIVLIYPKWSGFDKPFKEPFVFEDGLHLWVIPFDLRSDKLIWSQEMYKREFLYKFAA